MPHAAPDTARIDGYILAGGQSTRMGTDKALLQLGGTTFLARSLAVLASATTTVTVVGRPYPTTRSIPDAAHHIGPVGGVTATLRDLAARRLEWALFLPVDLPLLPAGLLRALAALWRQQPGLRAAFPIADGFPQPVVSLLHVSALPTFEAALRDRNHRLRPLLEAAAGTPEALVRTPLHLEGNAVFAGAHRLPWQPTPLELRLAPHWFSNCNTPADLAALEAALSRAHGANTVLPNLPESPA